MVSRETPDVSLIAIAYFSMEFMLGEALLIYSSGLGNVAGDQLKAARDLGVRVVGSGLLYQQGYFLLHKAARDYVTEQGNTIKPLQERLATYKAELSDAENAAEEYIKRTGRKGLSDDLLARYELEAQKARDRAKEIKECIAKTEAELVKLPR